MTLEELAARVTLLEAEVKELRRKAVVADFKLGALEVIRAKYAADPALAAAAEEADRLGREWREQVNRESLEEMDREEAAEQARAARPATPTTRPPADAAA